MLAADCESVLWQGICFEKACGEVAPLDDAAVRAQAALKALKEKAAGKGGFAKNTSERLLLPDYMIHAVCRHHIRKCSSFLQSFITASLLRRCDRQEEVRTAR